MEAKGFAIDSNENQPATKMKKFVPSLVVAIAFLAGCSSSDLSSGSTTIGPNLSSMVNGYKIEPYANLTGAKLSDTKLIRVDLYHANLTDADLRGANLSGANLATANLTYANLTNTKMIGTKLFGAKLTGAYQTFTPQNQTPNYEPDDDSVEDDYVEDYETCIGDCNDMDNDGRTWDDIDGDGDGRYESG